MLPSAPLQIMSQSLMQPVPSMIEQAMHPVVASSMFGPMQFQSVALPQPMSGNIFQSVQMSTQISPPALTSGNQWLSGSMISATFSAPVVAAVTAETPNSGVARVIQSDPRLFKFPIFRGKQKRKYLI
jgi:hypothetical protein